MKRLGTQFLIIAFATQLLLLPVSASCALLGEAEAEYDGYLVCLSDKAELSAKEAESLDYVLPQLYQTGDLSLVRELLSDGSAAYAEKNYCCTLFYDQGELPPAQFDQNGWAYAALETDIARTFGLNGNGVRIAVIDSGIDCSNSDLSDADIESGWDFIHDTYVTEDTDGHGTYVTQIIVGDNNSLGSTGIARKATIVPLRCFAGENTGTIAMLCSAIRAAVDDYHCDIINMSWGTSGNSAALHQELQYAAEKGCILVAAAGNVTADVPQGTVHYPAAYSEVIGVGSLTESQSVASHSQQTSAVFVCAPGDCVPIYSTKETTANGTSFAAPCVSAALALVKQLQPSLNGAAAMELLQSRAIDLGPEGYDTAYGYGAVNIRVMLAQGWAYTTSGSTSVNTFGWLRNGSETLAITAGYRQNGQMLGCQIFRAEGELEAFSRVWQGAASGKVFFHEPW